MVQIRTELLLAYKSKGYAEVQQQSSKLAESAARANEKQAKGYSAVGKEVDRLKDRLKDLAEEQSDLNRQLEMISDKASPAYKRLAGRFKEVQQEGSRVERVIRSMERAFKDQTKAMEDMQKRGAFLQGFVQGAVPGAAFMQRGPGMGRQAVGMAAGRAVRGFGGALAQTPFGGAQAIAGALREIPFVGGLLAAPFQQAAGWGGMALQAQRTRVGMLPFLGTGAGGMVGRARARAGGRRAIEARGQEAFYGAALAEEAPSIAKQAYMDVEREDFMKKQLERWKAPEGIAARAQAKNLEAAWQQHARKTRLEDRADLWARTRAGEEARAAAMTPQETARAQRRAARIAARRAFAPMREAGQQMLGITEPEAIQRAMEMVQAQGGNLEQLRRQGMLRTGMAAEALFGVQAGTAGAFARGGRLGALAGVTPGTEGAGARALTDQIAAAMEMGLSGAEIPMYLQQIASGITQWEQTGIPVADKAMAGFGKAVAEYGFAGPRAAAIGGGFVRAAQGLSTRGPQSAADLLMLQTMGGFKGRGGAAAFEEAQIRLEQLRPEEVGPEQIQNLVGRLLQAGGGGAAGRLLARQQLGKMGIQVGAEEMQLMGRQMTGEGLTEAQQARLEALGRQRREAAAGAPKTPEELQARAAKAMDDFGGALQKAAMIQNRQIDTGEKMIPMLQNLENTSGMLSKKFADLAGEPLGKLTAALEKLTDALVKEDKSFLTALKDVMGV